MKSKWLLLLPLVVLVGCGWFGEGQVELTTDDGHYYLDSTMVITLSVLNDTESDVFYICTGQVYLEERQSNELKGSWMTHGFEECYSAVAIEAGKAEDIQIDLGQLVAYGHLGGAVFDETVAYRLIMDLYKDEAFEDLVSDDQRRSPEFQILRND